MQPLHKVEIGVSEEKQPSMSLLFVAEASGSNIPNCQAEVLVCGKLCDFRAGSNGWERGGPAGHLISALTRYVFC